jgi:hypothetical protein
LEADKWQDADFSLYRLLIPGKEPTVLVDQVGRLCFF